MAELKLQSVSPAGGAYDAPAVLEETADTFVLTFNNPLATEQDADLVVFFAAPALPVHNCTYTIEGNTMTVIPSRCHYPACSRYLPIQL